MCIECMYVCMRMYVCICIESAITAPELGRSWNECTYVNQGVIYVISSPDVVEAHATSTNFLCS